jgi:hypothetical protein
MGSNAASDRTSGIAAEPPRRGQKFTLVEVTMFCGRSIGAKRRLYQAIVRNLAALDVPSHDIKITLIEPSGKLGLARRHAGFRNRPRLQDRRLAIREALLTWDDGLRNR